MSGSDALERIAAELRLLRESVERIESTLQSRQPRRKEPKPEPLTTDGSRQLYREIRDQFFENRSTNRLDDLLKHGHSDLRRIRRRQGLSQDTHGSGHFGKYRPFPKRCLIHV
jgi:hypothetical protein